MLTLIIIAIVSFVCCELFAELGVLQLPAILHLFIAVLIEPSFDLLWFNQVANTGDFLLLGVVVEHGDFHLLQLIVVLNSDSL